MKKTLLLATAVSAALSLAACDKGGGASGPPADVAKDTQTIQDGETQWVADLKAKDLEKVVGHYGSGAVLMIPNEPAVNDVDHIRAAMRQAMADPGFSLTFTADKTQVAASGDVAYTHGAFTETATNPTTKKVETSKGSYVTVYRKTADGAWKAIYDIASPSGPATAGAGKG